MVRDLSPLIPRLYFDEDVDARLAEALRQRSYDIETAVTAGLLGVSDEVQMAAAVSKERAIVTHNIKDFPRIHAARMEAGWEHWGIIILIGHSAVGTWLRRMENLLSCFSAEELRNQLFFLGAEFD